MRVERISTMSSFLPDGPTSTFATRSRWYISSHIPAYNSGTRAKPAPTLIASGVQCLLEPLGVAFGQPSFFEEAIHRFRKPARIILAAAVQFRDLGRIKWDLVAHFAARARPGTACEIRSIRDINKRCPDAAKAMPELVCYHAPLRRSRILQLDPGSAGRRRSLPYPLIEGRERCVKNKADQARFHERNLCSALRVERPVDRTL